MGRLANAAFFAMAATHAFGQSYDPNSDSTLHGTFEQYFETDPSHRGISGSLSYAQLGLDLSPNLKLIGSYVQTHEDQWLDELYAEYDHGKSIFKLGRFRSDFGFGSWSDLYYTPFIGPPIMRSYDVNIVTGISLNREDRGAEWQSYCGNMQWQLAYVDSSYDDWQIGPCRPDTGIGRVQSSLGSVLVGLDGFAKAKDDLGPALQIAGADLRWSTERTIVRGEYARGFGPNGSWGFYGDLFYRPPGLARTQLGVRYQGFHSARGPADNAYSNDWGTGWGSDTWRPTFSAAQVLSFGARQFLGPNLTLSVNYGAGNSSSLSTGLLGWSTQLVATYRF